MRIGIVGGGCVGQAVARSYLEYVDEVRVYDIIRERRTHDLPETLACDLIFISLPTPQSDGSRECDTSAIEAFFSEMEDRDSAEKNYVLRSTVPVGTTGWLAGKYGLRNLLHSPEFLTARCAATDAQMPARNVIGIPAGKCIPDSYGMLRRLYERRFPGVPIHVMTSDESEAVKLFQNSFFAVKIAFWNECRMFADKVGLNWQRVLEAVLADGRIAHSHTKVPGPDGKFGFGGECLIKDLANLIHCIEATGGNRGLVTCAALVRNEQLDRKRPPVVGKDEACDQFLNILEGQRKWQRANPTLLPENAECVDPST